MFGSCCFIFLSLSCGALSCVLGSTMPLQQMSGTGCPDSDDDPFGLSECMCASRDRIRMGVGQRATGSSLLDSLHDQNTLHDDSGHARLTVGSTADGQRTAGLTAEDSDQLDSAVIAQLPHPNTDPSVFKLSWRFAQLANMHLLGDLDELLGQQKAACAAAAVPICFSKMAFDAAECERQLVQLINEHTQGRCYVGTTVDPLRRWLGTPREEMEELKQASRSTPYARRKAFMRGHKKSGYASMYILTLTQYKFACRLEPLFIRAARRHSSAVDNEVEDIRGMILDNQFLYCCFGPHAQPHRERKSLFAFPF